VFERLHLLTRRETTGVRYHRNDYWLERLSDAGWYEVQLDSCFQRFSSSIDEAIDEVLSQWLQIRSEANGNKGLFDFDYSSEQMAIVQFKNNAIGEYTEFLDAIFEELWRRTASALERVRSDLTEQLAPSLMDKLDTLEVEVTQSASLNSVALRDAIANCRTDLNNSILEVARWFELSEAGVISDFQIALALQTAVEIIQSTFPTISIRSNILATVVDLIRGECLPHLLYAFYILLENVVKHAGRDVIDLQLAATVDSNYLSLAFVNHLGPEAVVSEIQKVAKDLARRAHEGARRSVIRIEGGSGYFKLGKILTHDLKARDWKIDVSVVNGKRFKVVLSLNMADLFV